MPVAWVTGLRVWYPSFLVAEFYCRWTQSIYIVLKIFLFLINNALIAYIFLKKSASQYVKLKRKSLKKKFHTKSAFHYNVVCCWKAFRKPISHGIKAKNVNKYGGSLFWVLRQEAGLTEGSQSQSLIWVCWADKTWAVFCRRSSCPLHMLHCSSVCENLTLQIFKRGFHQNRNHSKWPPLN